LNNPFQTRARKVKVLSHEQSKRQGQVVRSAHAALGDVDAVRDFLNSHHAALGGRPLDLAVASDEGLLAVEAAMLAEKPREGARPGAR
jgi:uncharacterized protein (DUF2384 family)